MRGLIQILATSLVIVSGCNWWNSWFGNVRARPGVSPLEVRNESNQTVDAYYMCERCPQSASCIACVGRSGAYGIKLLPGRRTTVSGSMLGALGGFQLELSNGDRVFRTDFRPISSGEVCIVTLNKKHEIEIRYVPPSSSDPPRLGTTLTEPINPRFDPEQSIVIRAYDKAERTAEILAVSYEAIGKDGGTHSGSLNLNKFHDGSVWIPLGDFRDIFRHEEFPELGWSLSVEAFALGRRKISFDPTKPAEIPFVSSTKNASDSRGYRVSVLKGDLRLGHSGGGRGNFVGATVLNGERIRLTLGTEDQGQVLTIDVAKKTGDYSLANRGAAATLGLGEARLSFVSKRLPGEELVPDQGEFRLSELSATECTGGFTGSGRDSAGTSFSIKGNFYGILVSQETKP